MKGRGYVTVCFMLALLMPVLLANVASAASTTVSIDPLDSYTTVGSIVSTDVKVNNVDPHVANLTSWQFIVYFSNHVLNCSTVTEGPFLKTSGGNTFFGFTITNDYNGTYGKILAYSTLLGNYSVSGSGVLATITFNALSVGDSPLHLSDIKLGDEKIPPQQIPYATVDGTVHVTAAAQSNLVVDNIAVQNQGCNVYANDTYANGTAYYVLVYISVRNVGGGGGSGAFNVSLSTYSYNVSMQENYVEWRVAGLNAGANTTLTFKWRPTHTGYYNLTAVADCHNEVVETNESDNTFVLSGFPVALIGDINGDYTVDIQDAVIIGLAWDSPKPPGTNPNWNIRADIDHDGTIDIADATRLGLNWNKTW